MPVLGLVIGVSSDASPGDVAAELERLGDVRCGEANGPRLPVTLARDDASSLDEALRAVADVAGVAVVDVVFHEFSDVSVAPDALVRPRERRRPHATS